MKKLLLIMLLMVSVPLIALDFGAQVDVNFVMQSFNDDNRESENYFGSPHVNSKLWAKQEMEGDMTGYVKLNLVEPKSDGIDSLGIALIEELWVSKKGPFEVAELGFKVGKMEVPFNLDYDKSITASMTNGGQKPLGEYLTYAGLGDVTGIGEIDGTWGFNVNYAVEGVGTFNLTLFEAVGGLDSVSGEDASAVFDSIALNWDTGADAFGVAGLRLVVGYVMMPNGADENANVISIGGTYSLMEGALTLGLEIDMSTWVVQEDGCQLIALDVDYDINEDMTVGLSYEMLTYNDNDPWGTDSIIALRFGYNVAEGSQIRFCYQMTSNSGDEDIAYDAEDVGGNLICIGLLSKF
jgi:hypothetical protein